MSEGDSKRSNNHRRVVPGMVLATERLQRQYCSAIFVKTGSNQELRSGGEEVASCTLQQLGSFRTSGRSLRHRTARAEERFITSQQLQPYLSSKQHPHVQVF